MAGGVVTKVNVDVGSRVKRGDPMVELDRRESSLRAAQASAAAAAGERAAGGGARHQAGRKFDPTQVPEVKAAKEAYDLAQSDADRTKALVEAGR